MVRDTAQFLAGRSAPETARDKLAVNVGIPQLEKFHPALKAAAQEQRKVPLDGVFDDRFLAHRASEFSFPDPATFLLGSRFELATPLTQDDIVAIHKGLDGGITRSILSQTAHDGGLFISPALDSTAQTEGLMVMMYVDHRDSLKVYFHMAGPNSWAGGMVVPRFPESTEKFVAQVDAHFALLNQTITALYEAKKVPYPLVGKLDFYPRLTE